MPWLFALVTLTLVSMLQLFALIAWLHTYDISMPWYACAAVYHLLFSVQSAAYRR